MVVWCDTVGDPAPGEAAALRLPDGCRGGGEPGPAVPGRGRLPVPPQARDPARHQGHRRPNGGVLEAQRGRAALLPRDTLVPATKDSRIRSCIRLDYSTID